MSKKQKSFIANRIYNKLFDYIADSINLLTIEGEEKYIAAAKIFKENPWLHLEVANSVYIFQNNIWEYLIYRNEIDLFRDIVLSAKEFYKGETLDIKMFEHFIDYRLFVQTLKEKKFEFLDVILSSFFNEVLFKRYLVSTIHHGKETVNHELIVELVNYVSSMREYKKYLCYVSNYVEYNFRGSNFYFRFRKLLHDKYPDVYKMVKDSQGEHCE
jgi:hypothetical protein